MKPVRFDYYRPETPEEALALLARYGPDAKVLAGGQSLMPLINMRLARPRVLVDASGMSALSYIREQDGFIAAGAMARQAEIEETAWLRKKCPLLSEAVKFIAHPAIRNQGRIGGSIAHADPAAELPAVVKTLGATIKVRASRGEREVDAEDFFRSFLTTCLEPDELVTEIRFPLLGENTGWAFEEVARRHGDFAIVGVAALLGLEHGRISLARLTLAGVGEAPVRAKKAEQMLVGSAPGAEAFRAAAESVKASIDPSSDLHASEAYRRHLAGVLTARALGKALDRIQREA